MEQTPRIGGRSLAQLKMKGEMRDLMMLKDLGPLHTIHTPLCHPSKGLDVKLSSGAGFPGKIGQVGSQGGFMLGGCGPAFGMVVQVCQGKERASFWKGIRGNVMEMLSFSHMIFVFACFDNRFTVVDGR